MSNRRKLRRASQDDSGRGTTSTLSALLGEPITALGSRDKNRVRRRIGEEMATIAHLTQVLAPGAHGGVLTPADTPHER
jgi:hypothetical protein